MSNQPVIMGIFCCVLAFQFIFLFPSICIEIIISLCCKLIIVIFLRLLLQVSTEVSGQGDEMSMSFGCSLKDCRHLLEKAKELGVQVVGVR